MKKSKIDIFRNCINVILQELNKHNAQHSCILANTIINDVFAQLGISDSFPLTVKPTVMNPALSKQFEKDNSFIEKSNALDWEELGYKLIKIVDEEQQAKNMWPAHLITIIPEFSGTKAVLCDPTITQFNYPDKGVILKPFTAPFPEGFLDGKQVSMHKVNECLVFYESYPGNISYKETTLWKDRAKQRIISRSILDRLK